MPNCPYCFDTVAAPGSPATLDTTRIMAPNPIILGVQVSRLVYPTPMVSWRPNAVILAPLEPFQYALAATSLSHFPFNAPILLTHPYHLAPEVCAEIQRLNPPGKGLPFQIILVGPLSPAIGGQLAQMGYRVKHIMGNDPYDTAAKIARAQVEITGERTKDLMVVAGEYYPCALPAAYYAAHSGVPILFAARTALYPATREYIREAGNPNVYVVGTEQIPGPEVVREIQSLTGGFVDRISGANPAEVAVNFSRYKSPVNDFGWARNQPGKGDAFTFATGQPWQTAVVGAILGHLGKHTPLLLVEQNRVPPVVESYLTALQPHHEGHHSMPPFMHGFVLGNLQEISFPTQARLEELLN